MNKPVKTKLCWNCEGSVSRTAENCPFCGVYLSPETASGKDHAALLTPPYTPEPADVSQGHKKQSSKGKEIPKAPYAPQEPSQEPQGEESSLAEASQPSFFRAIYLPLFLLTAGAVALLFSLLLLLFSSHGKLTLEWDAEIWYVYGLIAVPFLLFGWKMLDERAESQNG